jgi:F-type H+-transporting ATPase subunit delta
MKNDTKQAKTETYACFLMELARQSDCCEQIDAELEMMGEVIEENQELITILDNPFIELGAKLGLVDRIFGGRSHNLIISLIKSAVNKRDTRLLKNVTTAYRTMLDTTGRKQLINITLASSVSDEQKEQINRRLSEATGTPVRVKYQIDPSIIGGMIIKHGDTYLDNSVSRILQIAQKHIKTKIKVKKIENCYEV